MKTQKHNCKEELNSLKLRATPARLSLIKLFEVSEKPIDVASMLIYLNKRGVKADPATVFRIVNLFRKKGLIKSVQLNEGKFRYELASREDHHHLVCEICGEITDMSDCNIAALEKEIKTKKKFILRSHSLEFFGICSNCGDLKKVIKYEN